MKIILVGNKVIVYKFLCKAKKEIMCKISLIKRAEAYFKEM